MAMPKAIIGALTPKKAQAQCAEEINKRKLSTAYKTLSDANGFLFREKAKVNYAKLKKRVKFENKEEKRAFDFLMSQKWTLHHSTDHLEVIKKNGNSLLSIDEMKRRELNVKHAHTNDKEGNTDFIFFSIAPNQDITPPSFLEHAKHTIKVDLDGFLADASTPFSEGVGEGHMFAYLNNRCENSYVLGTTKFKTAFTCQTDEKTEKSSPHKENHFEHADGKSEVERINKGDETFLIRNVKEALSLLFIGKIRKLSPLDSAYFLDPTDRTRLLDLYHVFFNQLTYEVILPISFDLNKGFVQIVDNKKEEKLKKGGVDAIIWKALNGNLKEVKELLDSGVDVDTAIRHKDAFLTPMRAAFLGGHLEMIKLLMRNGAKLNYHVNVYKNLFPEEGIPLKINLVNDFLRCLCATEAIFSFWKENQVKIASSELLDLKYLAQVSDVFFNPAMHLDLKTNNAKSRILKLTPARFTNDLFEFIFNEYSFPEETFPLVGKLIEYSLRDSATSTPSLSEAIFSMDLQYVDFLLRKGADGDKAFDCSKVFKDNRAIIDLKKKHGNLVPNTFNPLMYAVITGNNDLLRLMLKHEADPDKGVGNDNNQIIATPTSCAILVGNEKALSLLDDADAVSIPNFCSTILRKYIEEYENRSVQTTGSFLPYFSACRVAKENLPPSSRTLAWVDSVILDDDEPSETSVPSMRTKRPLENASSSIAKKQKIA